MRRLHFLFMFAAVVQTRAMTDEDNLENNMLLWYSHYFTDIYSVLHITCQVLYPRNAFLCPCTVRVHSLMSADYCMMFLSYDNRFFTCGEYFFHCMIYDFS